MAVILRITFYDQAARQLEFFRGRSESGPRTDLLGDALAIAQHHDAVTGTEQQHVANDYAKRLYMGYKEVQIIMMDFNLLFNFPFPMSPLK